MLLDVYGNAKEYAGEKCFIPFRYQGQYEDEETYLFYNRFRYYDPKQGNYISQDPIGLAGNKLSLYQYAKDCNTSIDLLGWSECKWGEYYKKLSGTEPPIEMINPHAHHIVFRNGPPGAKIYIEDSQRILREAGIDPIYGIENFVWAPNKNHTIAAAKAVNEALRKAVENNESIAKTLEKLGKLFADDNISSIIK